MTLNLFNSDRLILDLCGGTGSWSKPYADAGYDVQIVDIKTTGQDVRLFKKSDKPVHGILAAPPCTEFALSGATHWKRKGDEALLEGLSTLDACLRIIVVEKPVFWALENPVGRAMHFLGEPALRFHPCDFGDPYTKYTCLWGNFNPALEESKVDPIKTRKGHHSIDEYHKQYSPGWTRSKRAMFRSITPPGFSNAFFRANP
jgi:hypothetical protein